MTSRRAVLLAAAGSFVATGLRTGGRRIEGGIVGASMARGHLLRDGTPSLPDGGEERCDIAIVGGGVTGLSAAWRLAPSGADVRLLELEPVVGGTSRSGDEGAVAHPWGAHYLPAPNPEARAALRLLEEMGVLTGWDARGAPRFDPRVLCHAPDERLFFRGAWHAGLVPVDGLERRELEELRRFTELTDRMSTKRGPDGRYLFQIPVAESSRDPDTLALDRLSMSAWLDREGFVTPFLRWYVRYATLDDFGGEPEDVSAWAGLHYFTARKVKSAELEGSHFLVWPEGNGRLVRALSDKLAPRSITSGAVALAVEPGTSDVVVRWIDTAAHAERRLRARAVVLAVPAFVARRLVARAPVPERKGSPWIVCNLHVERELEPNHPWDSVLYDGVGLGYVDAAHQLTPPRTRTVLTYFRAYGDADCARTRGSLASASWDELAGAALEDLAPAHPDLGERTSRIDVMVWGHAMPRPTVGFLGAAPFEERRMLAERVAWGHVDMPGMALFEEAQRSGVLAAEAAATAAGIAVGESWA
ncbi:MAG TPA: FAD-dependent oxidoreductase [Polyangiaceae bacterium]|nr:FAD-dependent oxidoreductase [Polyangiaceae bacterium]